VGEGLAPRKNCSGAKPFHFPFCIRPLQLPGYNSAKIPLSGSSKSGLIQSANPASQKGTRDL
jgi:hypothetical protein